MTYDWLSALHTHRLEAVNPWADCPLCAGRISAGERESMRLFREGATRSQYLDAAHRPRYDTLVEHEAAVAAVRESRKSDDQTKPS
jgi:hypothetical protein